MTTSANTVPARRAARRTAAVPLRATRAVADGATAQPLHARLRDRLRADILEGRLKPHDQLPSESQLTERHEVSRITVRQALSALLAEGLIVKLHGKGSFVAPPRVSQQLTKLEGLSEALGSAGREVATRVLGFEEGAIAPAAVARQLALDVGAQVCELLTLRYADRVPLSLNRSWLPADLGARLRRADLSRRDLVAILETDLGIAVGRAEVTISAAAAGRTERRHLGLGEHAPVLRVERVVHAAADDRPLQVEASVYRADTFDYRLTVTRG